MVDIPRIIETKFESYYDEKRWCFSKNKVPMKLHNPNPKFPLSWKNNPDEGVITLTNLIEFNEKHPEVHEGFGIITGDGLGCMDFDRFLENGQLRYNNKMDKFYGHAPTFVELSRSMKGTHGFYEYDKTNENVKEFGLDIKKFGINLTPEEIEALTKIDNLPGGKFYPRKHFINMTGIIHNNNDNDILCLTNPDYKMFEEKTCIQTVLPEVKKSAFQSSLTGNYRSWGEILADNGIPHPVATDYIGRASPRSGKLVIEAYKIPCPNRKAHNTHRDGDISADLAILCKYEDGTSSVTCNHNSCDPMKRPNLLQKLWNEIKQPQIEIGKEALKRLGIDIK